MVVLPVIGTMASDTIKVRYLKSYDSWKASGGGQGDTYKDTKQEAVDAAKNLARRYEKKVKVYKKNGSLQNTFDYTSSSNGQSSSSGGLFGF